MLISIIIPFYNIEECLDRCLSTVLNQTYSNLEVICIDDGSTDNTLKILREYAQKDSRIKIIQQVNMGAAAARNFGLNVAKGKYVIFLDSDDYFELNLIELAVNKAEKFSTDIVIFKGDAFDNLTSKRSFLNDRIDHINNEESFSYIDLKDNIFNSFLTVPWNKFYNRKFLENHNFLFQDLKRTNDLLFVCKTLVAAKKIVVIDKILVHYRIGRTKNLQATNERTPLDFYRALYALKKYLEKESILIEVIKSYYKLVIDVSFYNLNSISSYKKFNELKNFLKEEGFKKLGITNYNKLYNLTFIGYLQYKCIMSNTFFETKLLLKIMYYLYKTQQYFMIVGFHGLFSKIKMKFMIRRRN